MTMSMTARTMVQRSEEERQAAFDFLMPFSERRRLLTPREVAGVLHRSIDYVEAMIEEGKLEAFAPSDREKQRKTITRRSVLLLLAEQALGDPAHFEERLRKAIDGCTRAQLDGLLSHITRRRAALPL